MKGLYLLSSNRVTIINSKGDVLFDSDSDTEESHRYRSEVKQALEYSEGFEVRFSNTIKDTLIYYSTLYNDDIVIRIAESYSEVDKKVKLTIFSRTLSFLILNIFLFFAYKNILRKYYFDKLNHMRTVVESGQEAKEMYLEEDKDLVEFWKVIKDWQNKNLDNIERLNEEKHKLQQLISAVDIAILLIDSDGTILSHNREAKYSFFNDNTNNSEYNKRLKYAELIKFINKLMNVKQEYVREIHIGENDKHYIIRGKTLSDSNKYLVTIKDITQSKEISNIEKKFISNISHELKTPLTNIKGYLIAIEEEDDKVMQKGFIDIVHSNIGKMENIISDFLSLQKLESSKVLNKYPTDFSLVIDSVLNEVSATINERNAHINVDFNLKSKDKFINIDKEKIKTMLKNLIENGLIYNDKENPIINISVEESYEHLRISVKDNGIGIPEKEIKNIFNRFYRVDKARTANLGGTGLGLSLVKEIVDLYSGNINVISQEKNGTEFVIRILK